MIALIFLIRRGKNKALVTGNHNAYFFADSADDHKKSNGKLDQLLLNSSHGITSISTSATPLLISSILANAPLVRSMILPLTYGPRSFIRTMTYFLFRIFVTRTLVPKGSDLWAADNEKLLKCSPLAVFLN